jgi:hypothetical protein
MTTKKPTEDSQQDTSSIQERINAQKRKCKALTVTPSPAAARANDSNHGLSTQTDETNKLSTPADEALYQEYKEQLRHKRARAAGIPLAETPPSPAPRPNGKPVPSAGAILRLATGELLVFDRDVPARDYQLVYNLLPDGTASPEGICLLDAYEFEQIGLLSNDVFGAIRRTNSWDRDPIVFHLNSLRFAEFVPKPQAPGAPPSPRAQAHLPPGEPASARIPSPHGAGQEPSRFQRGQRLKIVFDKERSWKAVFWGSDEMGMVVAHKTGGTWAFMHLDLSRFADSIILEDGILTEKEKYELAEDVKRTRPSS